ncbi:MAG: DUF167 domain-containing protein [Candidatus Krumholzibacteria bacterium]|nr:DUF167 domain-containing protein [Candidatus Krumholzibacteria bacterium]
MKDIRDHENGRVGFRVRVQPSSRKDEIVGWNAAGELRVRIAAPPVEGAASRGLERFLGRALGLGKRDVRVESGERSRAKLVTAPASAREALEGFPEV